VNFQALLVQRGKQEEEERKKRCEEEEENKYDVGSYLTDARKWKPKAKQFNYTRRPTGILKLPGVFGLDKPVNPRIPPAKLGNSDTKNRDRTKSPVKRKMLAKKGTTDMDVKLRKSSMILGQKEKEEQIKRYHAMVSSQNGVVAPRTSTSVTNTKIAPKPRRNTVYPGATSGLGHLYQ
jgi:hypothetical protein